MPSLILKPKSWISFQLAPKNLTVAQTTGQLLPLPLPLRSLPMPDLLAAKFNRRRGREKTTKILWMLRLDLLGMDLSREKSTLEGQESGTH